MTSKLLTLTVLAGTFNIAQAAVVYTITLDSNGDWTSISSSGAMNGDLIAGTTSSSGTFTQNNFEINDTNEFSAAGNDNITNYLFTAGQLGLTVVGDVTLGVTESSVLNVAASFTGLTLGLQYNPAGISFLAASNGTTTFDPGTGEFTADPAFDNPIDFAATNLVPDSGGFTAGTQVFTITNLIDPLNPVTDTITINVNQVPEPSSLALLALGAAGILRRRRCS